MLPIMLWILGGAALGALLRRLAGPATDRRGLAIYGVGLAAAAFAYVLFAWLGDAPPGDLLREVVGLFLFALLAAAGVTRDPWLIGGGWLLHVLWDGFVHRFGTTTHAPDEYRYLCVGFDLVVGLWILHDLNRAGVE